MQEANCSSITINHRVAASSLVEVSVAAVLLSLALGFSVLLFEQVSRSGRGLLRLRQELQLAALADQVKREKSYRNEELSIEKGWTLVKKVSYYEGNHNLLLLELSLYDKGLEGGDAPGLIHREIIYEK